LIVATSLYLQTHISTTSGYELLLPAFALMGLGMGLVMAPMSTAAMNAVSPTKAGAASGILTMSRMVGGTFGVAAFGALFQVLSSHRLESALAGSGVTAAQRERIVDQLASGSGAHSVAGLDPATAQQVGRAARDAFIHALSTGMWLGAGVALSGALVTALLIRDRAGVEQPQAVPV
jgi:hypothetical protein